MLRGDRQLQSIRSASFHLFAGDWWERADVPASAGDSPCTAPAGPDACGPLCPGAELASPCNPPQAWMQLGLSLSLEDRLQTHLKSGWFPLCKHVSAAHILTFFAISSPPWCLLRLALLGRSAGDQCVHFLLCHLSREGAAE